MNKEILIIKLAAMGDVLRTTSILKGLKERCSGSKITWVTKKQSYDLLKNNQYIDKILLIERSLKELNDIKFDLVISLDDEDESCELATKINKEKLIGAYLDGNKKVYTEDSSGWFDMGLISKYGKEKADELKGINKKTYQEIISNMLDIKPSELILNLENKELKFAEEFAKKHDLKGDDLIIGLNTGAGKRWPCKKLSIEKTAELANMLNSEPNTKVILFGGPEETERNQKIKEKVKNNIIDAGCDNTLKQFAVLVNLCNIVIVSDSLAMHIAIALKKKVIAFFGPTSAAEIELYGRGKKIIAPIKCVSCYKKTCKKQPNCMDLIKIDDMIKSVKEIK